MYKCMYKYIFIYIVVEEQTAEYGNVEYKAEDSNIEYKAEDWAEAEEVQYTHIKMRR
jgi:hypothetical protein